MTQSPYPKYWTEVYDTHSRSWIGISTAGYFIVVLLGLLLLVMNCVRGYVNDPKSMENPNDPHAFIIGMDETDYISDVSRRYYIHI
jgi:hypothetical protein